MLFNVEEKSNLLLEIDNESELENANAIMNADILFQPKGDDSNLFNSEEDFDDEDDLDDLDEDLDEEELDEEVDELDTLPEAEDEAFYEEDFDFEDEEDDVEEGQI